MVWLGALPLSANALGQMQTVSDPFVWGAAGSRMTPEDIAFQRRLAASEQQLDYSPVGHWLQGAARAAGNIGGALRERRADEAAQVNAAEADAVMRALLDESTSGAQGSGAVTAALLNPNLPRNVRDFAEMRYQQLNPKPQQPTDFQQNYQWLQGLNPQFAEQYLQGKIDPEIIVPLPGGMGTYVGPRGGLADAMKGGGPVSTGPGGVPPSTLPPDFDFDAQPMTPTSAAPVLEAAAQSNVISPAQAQAIRSSLGPNGGAAFEAWLRKNNITIGAQ